MTRTRILMVIMLLVVVAIASSLWLTQGRKSEQAPPTVEPLPDGVAGNGAGNGSGEVPRNGQIAPDKPVGHAPAFPKPPAAANGDHKNGATGNGASKNGSKNGGHQTAAESPVMAPTGLESYKVELGVDAHLQRPGPPGELKVWIGDQALSPGFRAEMVTAQTTVPAIGQSARVTPFAPDFEVTPAQSLCMIIHPSGSEVRFAIVPRTTGTFNVGADVLLYQAADCQGSPVPKSAATLQVEVVVNKQGVASGYLLQLWDIFWKGVLDFWKWLVAAVFALLIFLIRKHLKKWFGFDAPTGGA